MPDWKHYFSSPEGRAAWLAEKEYHAYFREVMWNGISPLQQKILKEKRQKLQSAKAALAAIVCKNSCMNQFLNRHPRYIPLVIPA